MVEKSRLTDISYVLVSSQGRIVEQFPIAAIRKEAASLASSSPSKRSALRPLSTSTYSATTTAAQSFRLLLIEQLRILGHGLIERLSISPSTRRTLRHWGFTVFILFLGAQAMLSSLDRGRQDDDWLNDGSAKAACEEDLKQRLRDPSSYEPIDGWVESGQGSAGKGKVVWTWKFRSRNGFGGLNIAIASCVADQSDRSVRADVLLD